MAQEPRAQYLISLCEAAQEGGHTFGVAIRIGSQASTFSCEATHVISSLLAYSPAPDTLAGEFLRELNTVSGISHLVQPVRNGTAALNSATWSKAVLGFLLSHFSMEQRLGQFTPVNNLASEYLSHLLIAIRNPGGKKTPQDSVHRTSDLNRLHNIQDLLEKATVKRDQQALKQLLLLRDGFECPLTGAPFNSENYVVPRCAHILPFSMHTKHLTLKALEIFTGRQLSQEVIDNINHPCNAANLQTDAHDSHDKMEWGIEAKNVGNTWKYFYRRVRPKAAWTIKLRDGDEITFCSGIDGQTIDGPDPSYCNLRLSLARALHACGAADIIEEIYGHDGDEEIIVNQPVYLGGPFVSDDILLRRLDDRLQT